MKKKIIVAAVAAIVAVGAAWNLNLNKDSENLSELTLSNVEALAQEHGGCTGGCSSIGWGNQQILKCNNCSYTGWFSSCSWWGC